mmetsp:Transcript_11742/g.29954  ORF Transcript_11742/g.29954 Transcript_11742/m.29954 type:complete len:231 (-) Transcript_11742:319-1011(-)
MLPIRNPIVVLVVVVVLVGVVRRANVPRLAAAHPHACHVSTHVCHVSTCHVSIRGGHRRTSLPLSTSAAVFSPFPRTAAVCHVSTRHVSTCHVSTYHVSTCHISIHDDLHNWDGIPRVHGVVDGEVEPREDGVGLVGDHAAVPPHAEVAHLAQATAAKQIKRTHMLRRKRITTKSIWRKKTGMRTNPTSPPSMEPKRKHIQSVRLLLLLLLMMVSSRCTWTPTWMLTWQC